MRNFISKSNLFLIGFSLLFSSASYASEKKDGYSVKTHVFDNGVGNLKRKRRTDRTYVICPQQIKYTLGKNYLFENAWLDRPLMFTRGLDKDGEFMTEESWLKTADTMRKSRVNCGLIPSTPLKYRASVKACRAMKKNPIEGFKVIPVFYTSKKGRTASRAKLIEAIYDSGYGLMTPDGLPMATWQGGFFSPEQWREEMEKLKKLAGDRKFFICPDMNHAGPSHWFIYKREFYKDGKLSEKSRNEIKDTFRKYLDVCKGIMFNYSLGGFKKMNNQKFAADFYRDAVVPLFAEVLSEEKYSDRYLGLESRNGYYNFKTSGRMDEDGTKTLRASFEAALIANPDFIMMPEWNEVNENNLSQPTVYNSFTVCRILNYYDAVISGRKPAPMSGDDTSVPNMAVSYRKNLLWGEALEVELLNIPDSDSEKTYQARLLLKTPEGKTVRTCDWEDFTSSKLMDKTFVIPSEELEGDDHILCPVIEIRNPDGKRLSFSEGLHYIMIRPTWNRNAKYVKQPLRDIAPVESCKLDVKKAPDGKREISVSVKCGEKIKTLELLENGREVAAADPRNEFPSRKTHIIFRVGFLCPQKLPVDGDITVCGTSFTLYPFWHARKDSDMTCRKGKDKIHIRFHGIHQKHRMGFYLAVPRKNVNKAELDFNLNCLKTKIPLEKVVDNKAFMATFDKAASLLIEDFNRLPMLPFPLNGKEAELNTMLSPLASKDDFSVYHVRVITDSGKIWRSPPLVFKPEKTGKKLDLNVYSWNSESVVKRSVDSSRIPDLKYELSGRCGTLMTTAGGRDWWAELGALEVDNPFRYNLQYYPKNVDNTAPELVTEDGRRCLKFDGKGNFMVFPRETLPRGEFKMSFDIKPLSGKDQTLLFCRNLDPGSLHVKIVDGKLRGTYYGRIREDELGKFLWFAETELDPELEVPVGKWSRIEITYDLKNFIFRVNGNESLPIPCRRQGFHPQFLLFGGFGSGSEYFDGYLSSFRIKHQHQ